MECVLWSVLDCPGVICLLAVVEVCSRVAVLVVERSVDSKAVSTVGEAKAKVGSLPPLSHLDHKVSAGVRHGLYSEAMVHLHGADSVQPAPLTQAVLLVMVMWLYGCSRNIGAF